MPKVMPLAEWKASLEAGTEPQPDVILHKSGVVEIKAGSAARTVDFTISTGSVDRERDVINPDGWDLKHYKKSPVVLFAHDYKQPPIGRTTKIRQQDGALKATVEFAPAEANPMAETVYQLVKGGFLSSASVGFRPMKHAFNAERGGVDFEKQELLEWSIVPVPANPEALMDAEGKGIDVEPLRAWAKGILAEDDETKVVPGNVSTSRAPESEAWSAPSLGDFTDKGWGDLSASEKRHIAGHYAWANQMPPDSFGDLKLPHHRASDGAVVWRGVANALARLNQTQGIDRGAVEAHLNAHARAFGKSAEEIAAAKAPPPGHKPGCTDQSCPGGDQCQGKAATDPVVLERLDRIEMALVQLATPEPKAEESPVVFYLEDEEMRAPAEPLYEVDPDTITAAVGAAIEAVVAREVRSALNRLTGRVD